jgi:hypothetical protein
MLFWELLYFLNNKKIKKDRPTNNQQYHHNGVSWLENCGGTNSQIYSILR